MTKTTKTLLTLALAAGISSTAFAADASSFSDLPEGHWAYAAVDQLVKDGVLEGYPDGTFAGDRNMSRYELACTVARAMQKMDEANMADRALIEKLQAEFQKELKKMDDRMDTLEKKVDATQFHGFVQARVGSDSRDWMGDMDWGTKRFLLDLTASHKVNDNWTAFYHVESNKNWVPEHNNGTKDGGATNDTGALYHRIWADGKVGAVNVSVGTKWRALGNQCIMMGVETDGVVLDTPIGKNWNVNAFWVRPHGDENNWKMGNKVDAVIDNIAQQSNMVGLGFSGKIGVVNTALTYGHVGYTAAVEASNDAYARENDGESFLFKNVWELDASAPIGKDLNLVASYCKTDAEYQNKSWEARLNYKGADASKKNSYGAYVRYYDFGALGSYCHDTEWGLMPGNTKGWILGFDYVPAKNIVWSALYAHETQKDAAGTADTQSGNVFRTQVQFNF